jgi:hypothetical protein
MSMQQNGKMPCCADLLDGLCAIMVQEPFKLLIVDSIMANLRTDYVGRGELSERQQRLGQYMKRLKQVCNPSSCNSEQQLFAHGSNHRSCSTESSSSWSHKHFPPDFSAATFKQPTNCYVITPGIRLLQHHQLRVACYLLPLLHKQHLAGCRRSARNIT